jgi:hypothetical protein
MPDEGDEEMTTEQQLARAKAEAAGARAITREALRLMTPDQRERLRDRLVCQQIEEGEGL